MAAWAGDLRSGRHQRALSQEAGWAKEDCPNAKEEISRQLGVYQLAALKVYQLAAVNGIGAARGSGLPGATRS